MPSNQTHLYLNIKRQLPNRSSQTTMEQKSWEPGEQLWETQWCRVGNCATPLSVISIWKSRNFVRNYWMCAHIYNAKHSVQVANESRRSCAVCRCSCIRELTFFCFEAFHIHPRTLPTHVWVARYTHVLNQQESSQFLIIKCSCLGEINIFAECFLMD